MPEPPVIQNLSEALTGMKAVVDKLDTAARTTSAIRQSIEADVRAYEHMIKVAAEQMSTVLHINGWLGSYLSLIQKISPEGESADQIERAKSVAASTVRILAFEMKAFEDGSIDAKAMYEQAEGAMEAVDAVRPWVESLGDALRALAQPA